MKLFTNVLKKNNTIGNPYKDSKIKAQDKDNSIVTIQNWIQSKNSAGVRLLATERGAKRVVDINLIIPLSWERLILYGSEADDLPAYKFNCHFFA